MKKLVKYKGKLINADVIIENEILVYQNYFCKNCNKRIPWNKFHIKNGIPDTIHGHSFEGKHHTPKTKNTIRKSRTGKCCGIDNPRYGITDWLGENNPAKQPEIKIKISNALKGSSNGMFGKTGELNPNFGGKYGFKFGEDNIAKQSEVRKKISIGQIGKLNPNWNGGSSFLSYCPKFNFRFKESIRFRDNYTCQKCGKTQEQEKLEYKRRLTIHHIHYDKQNCYPDCICLCNKCNLKVNYNRDHYEELFTFMLWTRNMLYWRDEE